MQSYPFTSQVTYDEQGLPLYDRAVNSEFLRNVFKQYFSDGVFYSGNSACLQVAADTGMQVKVSPGACHIQGAMGIEYYQRTLVVQAAGAQDRIDTVVARLDLSVDARKIDLYVRQGTSGESPSAPALTRDSTTWELGLANLFIAKNTSQISQERITDTRLDTDRCGMVAAAVQPPFDTEEFFAQLNAAIAAHQQAADDQIADINSEWESTLSGINAEWDGWKDATDEDFAAWFQHIKDQLDEDAAGHLQLQVDEINDTLATGAITTYQHRKTGSTHHFIGHGPNGRAQMTADVEAGDSVVLSDTSVEVTVAGKTTQPGTGDPSSKNIRMIDGVGMYDKCVVFDGSEDEDWQLGITGTGGKYRLQIIATPQVTNVSTTSAAPIKSDRFRTISATGTWDNQTGIAAQTNNIYIYSKEYQTVQSWKSYLSTHPLIVWYRSVDFYKSKGPFYYVHEISDGTTSPYKAIGIELNAPLFDGDSLEIGGLSGFDQMLVLDGDTIELTYDPTNNTGTTSFTALGFPKISNPLDVNSGVSNYSPHVSNIGGLSSTTEGFIFYQTTTSYGINVRINSITDKTSNGYNQYLRSHPLIVFYKSVNYTEEADIAVALESCKSFYKTFDGTEEFTLAYSGEDVNEYDLVLNGAGIILPTSSDDNASCSHFKKGNFVVDGNWQATSMSNDVTIQFFRSKTDCPDVNSFKQWLQEVYENGTPVQCVMNVTKAVEYAHLAQPESLPAYYGVEDFVDALAGEDVTGKWLSFTNDGTQLNFKGGGGLSSSKLAAADAVAVNVLIGKKFYAGNKIIKTGTMPERGTWNATYAGTDITVPDGHHSGTGKITVDGGNQGAKTTVLNAGESYTIPKGWHNGSGKVTANSLASQTDANAAAGDILTGKMAWVKGSKIIGTMANRGAPKKMLGIGESYRLSAGYYSGGELIAKGSFSGSGSSGDKSGSYAEIYRNESNVTREIQARSHASASISGKTVTITVHAEAYQRANDIPSLSGTKSSMDYSFSFTIS